jgi:hypothetical protein
MLGAILPAGGIGNCQHVDDRTRPRISERMNSQVRRVDVASVEAIRNEVSGDKEAPPDATIRTVRKHVACHSAPRNGMNSDGEWHFR